MSVVNYFKASYNELLNKVTWPTWQQLINSAVVVVVASLIFALLIQGMDVISKEFLKVVYRIIQG